MTLVIANRWDTAAADFARRWASRDVRIVDCRDLSRAGWRQTLSGESPGTAVVNGKPVPQAAIGGVLNRLPCVIQEELVETAPPDRQYVAAEMTAFLWYWLSSLACPVLNRPTSAGLAGPCLRPEAWVHLGAQAEIPVETLDRRVALRGPEEASGALHTEVVVVGDRVFGETDRLLHRHARRLAEIARVELLAVRFSAPEREARFVSADTFPDLANDRIGDAVLEYLESRPVY
jgi:hypothetical protein